MRRKTSPRPIARASAVRPLVSETLQRVGGLPTAAALAAALFAVGCGATRTDSSTIGADDHDRGRVVLASNESTAHIGDGDEKPMVTVDGKPVPTTMPTTIAIAGGGL